MRNIDKTTRADRSIVKKYTSGALAIPTVLCAVMFVITMTLTFGIICKTTAFALDGDNIEPWERSAETHKNNLINSIEYIEKMDLSPYTDDSVDELESALVSAKSTAEGNSSYAETYWEARNRLELVRASLVPNSAVDGSAKKSLYPFRELGRKEIIEEMGTGINLGNTMDGHSSMTPGELVWQSVPTTKAIIRSMHDAGYNTIRVPVTWGNMINHDAETGEYSINEAWMNRVREIVDYCVSQDIYTIINIHHDGVNWNDGWFNIGHNDIDSVMEKYAAVWTIIADRFRDYDEHLIFESMNEMTCSVSERNMWNGSAMTYDRDILKSFNQLFVNTVRGTGGNNTRRWLASAGHFASSGRIDMPEDPCNSGTSHQMFAAHIYNSMDNILSELKNMPNWFDCPMYLGEWSTYLGTDGRTDTGYNDIAVAYDSQRVNRQCRLSDICPIVWNCGMYTNDDGSVQTGGSQYWNRKDMKPVFDSIIDGVMRGSYLESDNPSLESQYDSSITHVINTNITSISCTDSVEMTVGDIEYIEPEVSPHGTNDILIWRTDDDSIVTVHNGRLAAKRAGTTRVYVYAQNSVDYGYYQHYKDDPFKNAVIKEIDVTVKNDGSRDVTFTGMKDKLKVYLNEGVDLEFGIEGAKTDYISFISDDESVATVGSFGHVTGKKSGTTTIHAYTSSGAEKTIAVTVAEKPRERVLNVALFVYYNDSGHNFYTTEIGKPVKIVEDGTYTVSFDVDEDMSESGVSKGINTINNVGSIYIHDYDVHDGKILDSNITTAQVVYDDVKINGESYEIKDEYKDPFDPLLDGIFNTGRPINTWSGSIIDGVNVPKEHEAVFNVSNPTKIEVTFTVSGIEWKGPEETLDPDNGQTGDNIGNSNNGGQNGGQNNNGGVHGSADGGNAGVTDSSKADTDQASVKVGKVKGIKIKKSTGKNGTNTYTITWKKVKGAKYLLAYGTNKKNVKKYKGKKIKGVTVKTVKKNKYIVKKLGKAKKLYVKIRAVRNAGSKKIYGKWAMKQY